MRLLAIGDIHGCLRAFTTLLDAVALEPDDRIVTLGDYVDRGPDSRGVLDRLIALHTTGQLVALRGNHEVMMLEWRGSQKRGWLAYGGKETLRSYGVADGKIDDLVRGAGWFDDSDVLLSKIDDLLAIIPDRHWRFLEDDCLPYYETDKHIFVHANLYPDVALDEQPDYMRYWELLIESCAHFSGKTMICGHTRQDSGLPLDLGTTVCIDTGAHADGWLTCLDVHTGRIWQANERGESRTAWLQGCQ